MIRIPNSSITEAKKKKKKVASSVTTTTGSVGVNIDRFNDAMGRPTKYAQDPQAIDGGFGGYHADASMIHMSVPDGATGAADGADCSSGGDCGGMGESLSEAKIFSAKVKDYIDIPDSVKLLDKLEVSRVLQQLQPREIFKVGYITPVYFYKKLLDKFTLIKLTQLRGFTGVDARDLANEITAKYSGEVDSRAANQTLDPNGHTDYNQIYNQYSSEQDDDKHVDVSNEDEYSPYGEDRFNTENNKVKSRINGMRKDYGENEINKTVKQGDIEIYEIDPATGRPKYDKTGRPIVKEKVTDLKTILFVPETNSKPVVRYFLDLKDNEGFFEVDRSDLVDTIYKKVFDVIAKDIKSGKIRRDQDLTPTEKTFLGNVLDKAKAVIVSDSQTTNDSILSQDDAYKPNFRSLYTNQVFFLETKNETLGTPIDQITEALSEALITEKRETKRYYIRPQDIFCANKADVLKGLIEVANSGENCTVYSLKNLDDHDDVHKLTNHDIIYYYDDNVLYDKNHVLVMDYDLFIKHEEERKKINKDPGLITKQEYNQNYDDRMTKETVVESADFCASGYRVQNVPEYAKKKKYIVARYSDDYDELWFYGAWDDKKAAEECVNTLGNAKLIVNNNVLTEAKKEKEICCICGEEYDGYGNNAEPYKAGYCCDACNLKFVIPARLVYYSTEDEMEESLTEAVGYSEPIEDDSRNQGQKTTTLVYDSSNQEFKKIATSETIMKNTHLYNSTGINQDPAIQSLIDDILDYDSALKDYIEQCYSEACANPEDYGFESADDVSIFKLAAGQLAGGYGISQEEYDFILSAMLDHDIYVPEIMDGLEV